MPDGILLELYATLILHSQRAGKQLQKVDSYHSISCVEACTWADAMANLSQFDTVLSRYCMLASHCLTWCADKTSWAQDRKGSVGLVVSWDACMMQWEIYDAYIADQEKQRAQEELNKQKAAAKKATTGTETAETSQDSAKACLCCTLVAHVPTLVLCRSYACHSWPERVQCSGCAQVHCKAIHTCCGHTKRMLLGLQERLSCPVARVAFY